MKAKNLFSAFLPIAAFVLELFPNGVVLRFWNPEGEPWVRTYNYFSLLPFGYANFGPFLTAVLTCVLLALVVIHLFKPRKGLNIAIMNVSGLATVTSLMPLMHGINYITATGIVISVLLAVTFGLSLLKNKNFTKQ